MTFPKYCPRCGKIFNPSTRHSKYCSKCIRKAFIKSSWKRYGRFKDSNTLKEALAVYG